MNGRAVIFDMDGTLLDTLQDLGEAMNAVLERNGFPVYSLEAYRFLVGAGVQSLVRRALAEQRSDEALVERLVVEMREEYRRRWSKHTRVYPGIAGLLDELELSNLPKAILSNKPHDFTVQMAEGFLGAWSFAAVRGLLPQVPRKPDPAAALKIAREMGIPPAEIVFVGDSNIDMQTARAAGMYAAGVLWGFRDAVELRGAGAQVVLNDPSELLNLLVRD